MLDSPLVGIYALTDSHLLPSDQQLFTAAESALRGGLACLQYRDKTADASKALRQARELALLCKNYSTFFIVNDNVYLARACQADGVHLGQGDGSLVHARELLGDKILLGRTCHNSLQLAKLAAAEGADYLAFGRCYASSTKPLAPAASLAIFTQAAYLGLPLVAIGGINTPERAAQAKAAGASMIACVEGIFAQANPEQAVHRYQQAICTLFASSSPRSLPNSPALEENHDSLCRTF